MAARPKRTRRGIGRTDQRSQMMNGTASLFDASALGNEEDTPAAEANTQEQRPAEPAKEPAQGPPTDAAAAQGGGEGGVPVKQSKGMCTIL